MKKLLLILVSTLLFTSNKAQLHHVTGQKAIAVTIGSTKYSPFKRFQLEATMFNNEKTFWKTGVSIDNGDLGASSNENATGLLTYQDYQAHVKYGYSFFNYQGRFFASGIGGVQVGVQNTESKLYNTKTSKFIYGLAAGLELEYYFINNIGITAEFNQMITFGSELSNDKLFYLHYYYAIGVKYIF